MSVTIPRVQPGKLPRPADALDTVRPLELVVLDTACDCLGPVFGPTLREPLVHGAFPGPAET